MIKSILKSVNLHTYIQFKTGHRQPGDDNNINSKSLTGWCKSQSDVYRFDLMNHQYDF